MVQDYVCDVEGGTPPAEHPVFYGEGDGSLVHAACPMLESDGYMCCKVIPPKDWKPSRDGRVMSVTGSGPLFPDGIGNMLESGEWDISETWPYSEPVD